MENRAYFYGAAARVMRRVLVDHARRRGAHKRDAERLAGELTAALDQPIDVRMDLIALNNALDALAAIAPEKAKVIERRFFGGLTIEETADYIGIAPATVKRHIAFARAGSSAPSIDRRRSISMRWQVPASSVAIGPLPGRGFLHGSENGSRIRACVDPTCSATRALRCGAGRASEASR